MFARVALLAGCLVALSDRTQAAFVVTLSASRDLTSLHVGDTATVEVGLTGPSAADPLDALGVTVSFPADLLVTSAVTAGAVVPAGGGFVTSTSPPGTADATYDLFLNATAAPITQGGTFFSFEVRAVAAGSGAFTLSNLPGFQGFDPAAVGNGTPAGLDFVVTADNPVNPVPGPSSLALAAAALCGLAWACRGRRARPAVS